MFFVILLLVLYFTLILLFSFLRLVTLECMLDSFASIFPYSIRSVRHHSLSISLSLTLSNQHNQHLSQSFSRTFTRNCVFSLSFPPVSRRRSTRIATRALPGVESAFTWKQSFVNHSSRPIVSLSFSLLVLFGARRKATFSHGSDWWTRVSHLPSLVVHV